MNVPDRWVSYAPHMCVCDSWAQWHVKIHRRELVGSFTVNTERAFWTWKPSSEQKNALREFLQGQTLLVNLLTGFPASSNRCRCAATYSAIKPTILASKQITKSWSSWPKKKLLTCSHWDPGISEKTKETKDHYFNGKLHLWSNPVRKHLQKQELIFTSPNN